MQNGFLDPAGSCVRAGFPAGVLAPALEPCQRAVKTARDAGVPIIFTRYTYRADFGDGGFMLQEKFPILSTVDALIVGSWDHAVVAELNPDPADYVVDKNRPSAFLGTPLESYLSGLGVTEVVVCGVTTNCCVETTVRDAAQRDLRTFVLTDAVAEWEPERHNCALRSMEMLFAHGLTTAQLESAWMPHK
jgi:ureidoacrylate peracid hydrolase